VQDVFAGRSFLANAHKNGNTHRQNGPGMAQSFNALTLDKRAVKAVMKASPGQFFPF
jgi:hypothetical protein